MVSGERAATQMGGWGCWSSLGTAVARPRAGGAFVGEVVLGEEALDDLHALAEAGGADGLGDAEAVELVLEGAAADADLEAAVAEDVGHADLAGEAQGVVVGMTRIAAPTRMRRVWAAALTIHMSGDGEEMYCTRWCSGNHAVVKPASWRTPPSRAPGRTAPGCRRARRSGDTGRRDRSPRSTLLGAGRRGRLMPPTTGHAASGRRALASRCPPRWRRTRGRP